MAENNKTFYNAQTIDKKFLPKVIDELNNLIDYPILVRRIDMVWGHPTDKFRTCQSFSDFFTHLTEHDVTINEIRNYDGVLTVDVIQQTGSSWFEIKKLTDTGLAKIKKTNFDDVNQDMLNDIFCHNEDSTHLDLE